MSSEPEGDKKARRLFEEKCDEAFVPETMFNDTIKDTLERADALERRVTRVTMRAESLATTDADFFKTLVNRQGKPRTS